MTARQGPRSRVGVARAAAVTGAERRAYSIAEVAQRLGVGYYAVRNAVADQQIAAFKVGREWRIADHELERLLHSADPAPVEDDGAPALRSVQ